MTADKPSHLVPKLRFAEFVDEPPWKCPPLKKLAKRITQRNTHGADLRALTNSAEHGVVDQREYFGRDIATNTDNYYVVETGDYVYNPRTSSTAPVGPISKNQIGTGVMSPLYTVFRFRSDANDFFAQYFKSSRWHGYLRHVSNSGARHDRMAITIDDLMQMPIPTPSPREQQKIADCLGSLHDLIAAEGRKLEALQQHKKGLMQQLFPQLGETVPRLRFPEFANHSAWKSSKLEAIGQLSSGTTPARANPEFFDGGNIPWVKTKDLNNSLIDATEEHITARANARINPPGSILIAMYGGYRQIGRTGLLTIPAATNQAISVLVVDQGAALPVFVLAWLNARVGDWKRIASSSRKDPNITGADVASFPIRLPSIPEQRRSAACLAALDDHICAQDRKLYTLNQHKRGMLQQLFPKPETE